MSEVSEFWNDIIEDLEANTQALEDARKNYPAGSFGDAIINLAIEIDSVKIAVCKGLIGIDGL